MIKLHISVYIVIITFFLLACNKNQPAEFQRPRDPWAFRSVLDRQPRMLTLALDAECYAAYDLAHCSLYKVWKGGVTMEGAAYTDKKNVQPSSWGTAYYGDTLQHAKWIVEVGGKNDSFQMASKGYVFRDNQIYLKFLLILASKDTIHIEERPEFIKSEEGKPALERMFTTTGVPEGITISLESLDTIFKLKSNKTSRLVHYFNPVPTQFPPEQQDEYDHRGRYYMEKSDCFTCHEIDQNTVGPSLHMMAQRYQNEKNTVQQLISKVKKGGAGVWGSSVMNPHPDLNETETKAMVDYILSLKAKEKVENNLEPGGKKTTVAKYVKPGFGTALEGVHPSYDLYTIRKQNFQPRVGGLAFLPDGRLLVTTWDFVGGVYLLDGVQTGDTNKITVKLIASGLAEPLGIAVVNGEIFVLQKQELTKLIDLDGDEIIDEYQAVCNSWGVSGDFHEFSFGLLYKDGLLFMQLFHWLCGSYRVKDKNRIVAKLLRSAWMVVLNGLIMVCVRQTELALA